MLNLIARNTPKIKDNFILKTVDSDNGFDTYEIYEENNKIVLAGNSTLSQAMAYYRYLNEFCGIILTNGDYDISTLGTAPMPSRKITHTVKHKIRARISYNMFSLRGNFWGFDRWQKEIDFMAMQGFNKALQPVGFDGIIFKTLTSLGMSEEFCLEYASGPAYLMRHLNGNVAGLHSVNSKEYLERKISTGRMISERERELGIEPIFPAAMPNVPFSLRKKYIKMDIFKSPTWYNLPPTFFIKPENGFFQIFNEKFLKIQQDLLGETHSFIYEPVYDANQKGYTSHIEGVGKALQKLLESFDEKAVCYTHIGSICPEFFNHASPEKFIIIDDRNAHKLIDFLDDKKYIIGISGNYCGRTAIYGDIDKLCNMKFKDNSLGVSIEIDSFDINPMYCSAALKRVTEIEPFDSDNFVADFARKRYKTDSFTDSIIKLKNICNTDECAGSIICARPCTNVKHTAPYDTMERKVDFAKLYDIAKEILDTDARKIDALREDIQSIVCMFLSELAYPVYLKATEFFRNKSVGNFEQASNLFIDICEDMDRLLLTRKKTCFLSDYEEAQELGNNKKEKEALQVNMLMLHTIWAPYDRSVLYDTFWCEKAGLISNYYAQRWHRYFRTLAAYFENPKKLKDNSRKQPLDRNDYKGSYQLKRMALLENEFLETYIPRKEGIEEEDTIEVSKEILEKYSEVYKQF